MVAKFIRHGILVVINKISSLYKQNTFLRFLFLAIISFIGGLCWFLFLFGRGRLSLTDVNWIYKAAGDVFKQQIGWEWFRQEPWHFPLGHIDSYGYPFGTSLSYMDSIPLIAIPFKILSPLLKQNCQFFGLWDLASLIGMMFFGMLIIQEFNGSFLEKLIGASILVLSPPLLFRFFYQDSLTAQWIILAAIWLIIREYKDRSVWRGSWAILFVISMFVHMYFLPLIFPLWLVSLFFRYRREKKWISIFIDLVLVAAAILISGFCLGLFSLGVNNLTASGWGYFSWNVNGFFNPLDSSSIFHPLPVGDHGQYEGFSYLGSGNFLLIVIGLVLYLQKGFSVKQSSFWLPLVIISVFYIFYSLSSEAYINSTLLWNIKLSDRLLSLFSIFRASGRFVWPVFYLIVLFGMISNIRNLRFALPLFIFALVLQMIDIQPLYSQKYYPQITDYSSPLHAEFWEDAATTNSHIDFIPGSFTYYENYYEPIALYARRNRMTLNTGYFSRADMNSINLYAQQIWLGLKNGQMDNQTIYVFWDSSWETKVNSALSKSMVNCYIDGYHVLFSPENELMKSKADLSGYCTFPK